MAKKLEQTAASLQRQEKSTHARDPQKLNINGGCRQLQRGAPPLHFPARTRASLPSPSEASLNAEFHYTVSKMAHQLKRDETMNDTSLHNAGFHFTNSKTK